MYSVSDRSSFKQATLWLDEVKKQGKDPVLVLVGNKLDLEQQRQVETEEGMQVARDNNLLFMETSAKTATNINEVFNMLALRMEEQSGETTVMSLEEQMTVSPSTGYGCTC